MVPGEPAPRPEKKGLSGCAIAAIVAACLVAAAITGIAWFMLRTPQGKQTVELARTSAQMMVRAAQAPGTSELKKTLCKEGAFVLDLDEFRRLEKMLQSPPVDSPARVQVICGARKGALPSCGDVARAWMAAAGRPARDFEVVVKRGAQDVYCAELYSPAGERIGEGHPNP